MISKNFIGVAAYIASFALFPLLSAFSFVFLWFTRFWWVAALLLIWLYIDRKAPTTSWNRTFRWTKRLPIWRWARDYFPMEVHMDKPLDPANNYIIAYHPHGFTVVGGYLNFGTEVGGFYELCPEIKTVTVTIDAYYNFPIFRAYLMGGGMRSCAKESFYSFLGGKEKGIAIVLMPGGAEEALESCPEEMNVILKPRRGFIKMALKTGAHLVPTICFGENQLYNAIRFKRGSWQRKVQNSIMSIIGFSPPILYGPYWWAPMLPYSRPLNVVIGEPIPVKQNINPTYHDLVTLHSKYIDELRRLFENNKMKFGLPEDYKLNIY